MRLLFQYLKPHSFAISITLGLATIAQLLSMIDPIIFGKIIDDYATPKLQQGAESHFDQVLFWLFVALGIAFLSRLSRTLQDYSMQRIVAGFGLQVFNDGLRQTLRLRFTEFEETRSGETLSILQKIKNDTERFIRSFINVVFSSLVGIGFLLWYSITKSGFLIPIFLVGVLLLGSLTGLLSRHIRTIQRSINRETNRLSGIMTESLRNIELVKSLGLTFSEIRRLNSMTHQIYNLEMLKVKRVRILSLIQGNLLNLFKHSVLFMLLWLVFNKVVSTGELIAMQFMSTAIFGPLQELGNIIVQYREVEAAITQFEQLMQKPIEKRPQNPIEIGKLQSLRFDEVVYRYRTGRDNALDSISFEAKLGESVAFVGPSGSGKSTLVKLLVGLYQPNSGRILFNDTSSLDIQYNPLRRQIGFVTQDTHLFATTIRENLLFAKSDSTDQDLIRAMTQASALKILEKSSNGLDTLLGENGMKLSGGEKQRLSIARALLRKPPLLIFDEATSALDSLTEDEISETIQNISLTRNQMILMIAHRLSTIMHADVIHVLEKGKIIESGNHNQLLAEKGLYFAMWRQQIGERS